MRYLKQCPDSNCRFHPSIFTFSCLSNSQMQRIIPSMNIHLSHEQTVRLDHDHRVARFHRENKVVVVYFPTYPCKLKRRFNLCDKLRSDNRYMCKKRETFSKGFNISHHSSWRIPVIAHDSVRKTSMISPYTHCSPVLFAFLN